MIKPFDYSYNNQTAVAAPPPQKKKIASLAGKISKGIDIISNTILPGASLVTNKETPKKLFKLARDILQGTARSGGMVGLSAVNTLAPDLFPDELYPGTKTQKVIFGEKPVLTIPKAIEKTKKDIAPYVGSKAADISAFPLVVGSIFMDFTGTGAGAKKVSQIVPEEILKLLAKSKTVDEQVAILRGFKVPEKAVVDLAPKLARTNTVDEVKQTLIEYGRTGPSKLSLATPEVPVYDIKNSVTFTDDVAPKVTIFNQETKRGVSEIDRLIVSGDVRVVSREGKDVYQVKNRKTGDWVSARDEDSAILKAKSQAGFKTAEDIILNEKSENGLTPQDAEILRKTPTKPILDLVEETPTRAADNKFQVSDEGIRIAPTARQRAISEGRIKPGDKLPTARSIPAEKVNLPQELKEMQDQIDALEATIIDDPALGLERYIVQSGDQAGKFPEVTGGAKASYLKKVKSKDVLKFAKQGDVIVTEFGFSNVDEAQEALRSYMKRKIEVDEMKKQLRVLRRDYILAERDRVALNKVSDKTGKEIENLNRIEERKRALEAGINKLKSEAAQKADKISKINRAFETPTKPIGFFNKLRQTLAPVKFVDQKTKDIILAWNRKLLKARTLADKEIPRLKIPEQDTMQTIFKYEVGAPTKYSAAIKKAFNDLFVEARSRGIDLGYEQNYLPHVYKEKPSQITKIIEEYLIREKGMTRAEMDAYMNGSELGEEAVNRLKLNPRFSKERTFPTYEQAMNAGLTPKYTNLDQLLAYYREELEKVVANRELIDDLTGEGKILPVEVAPDHWRPVNLPFSHKGYYAEARLATLLNGIFRGEAPETFGEAVVSFFGDLSRRAQEIALSAGVPKTSINFFSMGQLIKQMTSGDFKSVGAFFRANSDKASIEWFKKNQKYLQMMAEEGIDLGTTVASFPKLYKNLVAKRNWKEWTGDTFDALFNEKTFGSFMPQLYTQTFKSVFDKAAKKMGELQAKRFAAETTRKMFGMTDFTGRSRPTENTMSSIFFAPKFREGIINTLVNTGKSFTTKIKDPTYALNRRLFLGMVLTYGAYNLLNHELNGEYMWDNPSNRKFALRIPTKDGSTYIEFMPSFLAFARNLIAGGIAFVGGDTSTAAQKFGSVFSMPVKLATEVWSNKDYFGYPIYKDDDTLAQKGLKAAEHVGLSVNHPYVEELINQLGDKKPLYQSIITALEFPLKFSSKESEAKNEFYGALDKIQSMRQIEQEPVKKIYDHNQQLIAEGRAEEAQDIVDTLSDADYEIYKKIKAAEKTKATIQGKKDIIPVYQEVQKLKAEGKIDEATAIVEGLSDDEYRYYQSVKKQSQEATPSAEKELGIKEGDPVEKETVLKQVVKYAQALGVDPATAFKALFTKEQLEYVKGNVVVLKRIAFEGDEGSEAIAQQRAKEQGVDRTVMRLDHTIPRQLGGDNSEGNLDLITTAQWESFTPVENYLGKLLRENKMKRGVAQKLIKQFKNGEITAEAVYNYK